MAFFARLYLTTALVSLPICTAAAQETSGAEQSSQGLEEIVVTARKTSENLQEVPISISAISADSLEKRGVSNVAQVADFTPNVTFDSTAPISGSSSALVAYIRGIGQSDYAMNFEPGVGVYVDGVYVARNVGGVMDLLDLERVEILKGPQGTLFGRNTIGGAISLVTKKPSAELSGKIEATTGRYRRLDVRGSLNVPLADTLFASFAFSAKNRDGFVHRILFPGITPADPSDLRSLDGGRLSRLPNGNDLGNENSDTGRVQLLWTPGARTEVRLIGDYTRTRENAAPSTLVNADASQPTQIAFAYNLCVAGVPIPACNSIIDGQRGVAINPNFTSRLPYDNRFLTPGRSTTYGNGISGTALDSWGLTLDVSHELSDGIDIRSITGYRNLDVAFGEDADMSPLVIDHHGFETLQEQFSQEFQLTGKLDSFKWVAGLYYFWEGGDDNGYVPLAGGLFQVFGPNKITNRSYAAYAEGTYNLTDALSVTFGGRYTAERKRFRGGQRDLNNFSGNFVGLPPSSFPVPSDPTILYPPGLNKQKYNDFSMRGGVQYKINDDIFTYVSYSEGFKAGGWDTRLTGPSLVPIEFQPETARTWEIGLKSELFDRSLRFNIAAFSTNYQNLQLIVQRGISPLTANAGRSKIEGVEVDAVWAPAPDLQLSASYGYINARYTFLDARALASGIGYSNQFVNTPKNTASVAIDYGRDIGSGRIAIHGDLSWKDDVFNDAVNTPQLQQKSMALANASMRYTHNDKWNFTLGASNLFDKRYIVSGFNQPGVAFIYETHGRPREWYFQVGYSF
ncbi:MAG: TonB-dependent receptor [Sphingomonadaceae bacterium]|nr:TonB-dependent receptor [Sphingomonadaceae bacterium]